MQDGRKASSAELHSGSLNFPETKNRLPKAHVELSIKKNDNDKVLYPLRVEVQKHFTALVNVLPLELCFYWKKAQTSIHTGQMFHWLIGEPALCSFK